MFSAFSVSFALGSLPPPWSPPPSLSVQPAVGSWADFPSMRFDHRLSSVWPSRLLWWLLSAWLVAFACCIASILRGFPGSPRRLPFPGVPSCKCKSIYTPSCSRKFRISYRSLHSSGRAGPRSWGRFFPVPWETCMNIVPPFVAVVHSHIQLPSVMRTNGVRSVAIPTCPNIALLTAQKRVFALLYRDLRENCCSEENFVNAKRTVLTRRFFGISIFKCNGQRPRDI